MSKWMALLKNNYYLSFKRNKKEVNQKLFFFFWVFGVRFFVWAAVDGNNRESLSKLESQRQPIKQPKISAIKARLLAAFLLGKAQ